MKPDLEEYLPYLEGSDMNEAQKAEFIHTVWTIMESFVDRAFGQHPGQQCPGIEPNRDSNGAEDRVALGKQILKDQFKQADGLAARQEATDHEGK